MQMAFAAPHCCIARLCAVACRSAEEIAGIRAACRVGREVLDAAHAIVKPGVTTDEIDRVVSGARG
jgi:methionyl aminopeptidase